MSLQKRYTFQPRISAGLASQLNTNFDDIIDAFNSHRHTGVGTDAQTITNSGLAAYSAWASYTPALQNVTVGNGTLTGRFLQVGSVVFCKGSLTIGSTTSLTGVINTISLPVSMATNISTTNFPIGLFHMEDAGTFGYQGTLSYSSTSAVLPAVLLANSTYAQLTGISNTAPFTAGTGDILNWSLTYEAAV